MTRRRRRTGLGHDGSVGRHRAQEQTDAFRLLFVCTGNICRSPVAEILMRDALRGRLGGRDAAAIHVSSAGVAAVVGHGVHPDSRAELAPWNLDGAHSAGFAARQLRPTMIQESDLVLGATSRHRSAVVQQCPAALPLTFSLREFARLVSAVDGVGGIAGDLPAHPVARAHALVELARMRRGLVPPDPDGDEIPDPIGRARDAHHHATRLTHAAIVAIVDAVAPRRRLAVLG